MSFVALQYLDAERTIIQAERPDGTLKIIEKAERDLWDMARDGRFGEIAEYVPPPPPVPRGTDVDAERDRRMARFAWNGHVFQMDESSQQLIIAAGADARFAIADGAQPGDLRWADPDHDFAWWDASNVRHPMDAPAMQAFAEAAKRWVAGHRRIARDIKDGLVAGSEDAPATLPELKADRRWP